VLIFPPPRIAHLIISLPIGNKGERNKSRERERKRKHGGGKIVTPLS